MQHTHQRVMEDMFDVADVHRMTGVGATLVSDHGCNVFCENIDNLAFALVTPIQSDHADMPHVDDSVYRARWHCPG